MEVMRRAPGRHRRVGVLATLVALLLTPIGAAQARNEPSFRVLEFQPRVQYFGEFDYGRVEVAGGSSAVSEALQRTLNRYVMPWVNEYRRPDREMREYLRRAEPAYFSSYVELTPDCRSGYVCVSQETFFSTRLIAGSLTNVQARAWSVRTGERASLRDFVTPAELTEFTRRVVRAIKKSECYYGFLEELRPVYSSFPFWVPVDDGIRLWYPEYMFACNITEVAVPWR